MSHDARAIPSARRFRFLFGLAINTAGVILLIMLSGAALTGAPSAGVVLTTANVAALAACSAAMARSSPRHGAARPPIPSTDNSHRSKGA